MSDMSASSDQSRRLAEKESTQGTERQRTSVVKLIVKLEQLARVGVPTSRRIYLLRKVDAMIADVEKHFTLPIAATGQSQPPQGILIEHRIYSLMAKNLKLALLDLDRSTTARALASAEDRPWLIRRLFGFLARSIELSMTTGRPWAQGIWSELHELYYYVLYRQDAEIDETREIRDMTFDPELEYKRLLLLGLARQMGKIVDSMPELMQRIPMWARQTRLKEPRIYEGTFGVYLVDITKDVPARECPDVVQATSSTWILEPAHGFFDFMSTLPNRWDVGIG